jgi:hypothetical protein
VLIDEENRLMVPHVKISPGVLGKDDWLWVQKLRWSQEQKLPIFTPTDMVPIDTPITQCRNFQQKFYRALSELKVTNYFTISTSSLILEKNH